jgi:tetratricopeptide (TPR) repeat protein
MQSRVIRSLVATLVTKIVVWKDGFMLWVFKHLVLLLGIIFVNCPTILAEDFEYTNKEEFVIHDITKSTRWFVIKGETEFDYKATGNMLNVHFFPGLLDYYRGNHNSAFREMNYCIDRANYLEVNPQRFKYLSLGHYIRGMIYLYHASGGEKYTRAARDFEQAIQWNPGNHLAYLELSRVSSMVGLKEDAIAILRQLLQLQPAEGIAQQARKELGLLKPEKEMK